MKEKKREREEGIKTRKERKIDIKCEGKNLSFVLTKPISG